MTNSSSGQARVSVNLDIANLPAEAAATILREAGNYGRVVTARAFADFRRNDLGDLPVQLFQLGFQLVHCPSWPNGGGRLKSVVDSILAQDLRDQAEFDATIEVFVLGSGDRDFLAVLHALRRHGRRVVIASTADASSRSLLATADGYIQIQAPERHTFHAAPSHIFNPQAPAAVYSGPVPVLPPTPAPVTAPAPARPAFGARAVRQQAAVPAQPTVRPQAAPVRQQAAPVHPVAPRSREYTPAMPASVHPQQPHAGVLPAAPPPALEPPFAASPVPAPLPVPAAIAAAPVTAVPVLTAATLADQILQLVTTKPQITPRQVLQALAPRAEAGSARRRQAIGDAIAQLVQQGRLTRRTEVVRGRPADILALSDGTAPVIEVPAEIPAALAAPAPREREAGRNRMGDRRYAERGGEHRLTARPVVPPPTFREPFAEPDIDLAPDQELDYLAGSAEADLDLFDEAAPPAADWLAEPLAAEENRIAPATNGVLEAEAFVPAPAHPEPAAIPQPKPRSAPEPRVTAERSAPEPRRAPAGRLTAAPVQPVKPASRFRAPVFTHTPAVAEAGQAAQAPAAPPLPAADLGGQLAAAVEAPAEQETAPAEAAYQYQPAEAPAAEPQTSAPAFDAGTLVEALPAPAAEESAPVIEAPWEPPAMPSAGLPTAVAESAPESNEAAASEAEAEAAASRPRRRRSRRTTTKADAVSAEAAGGADADAEMAPPDLG